MRWWLAIAYEPEERKGRGCGDKPLLQNLRRGKGGDEVVVTH